MKLDVLPTSTQANPRCKKWGIFQVTYAMYEVSSHGELTDDHYVDWPPMELARFPSSVWSLDETSKVTRVRRESPYTNMSCVIYSSQY